MDPLMEQLLKRQGLPLFPPNHHATVPSADKRFQNAQELQANYRAGITPNPTLIKLMLGIK